MLNNVAIENGMFGRYVFDRNGDVADFHEYGTAVLVEKINILLESGDAVLDVSFDYLGENKKLQLPRADFAKSKLLSYAGKGMSVHDANVNVLVESLLQQELDCKNYGFMHTNLGWLNVEGKKYFRSHRIDTKQLVSSYYGDLDIEPKGSFDTWKEMVKKHVIGNTPMELALTIGLSAVLVGYSGSFTGNENLFIHLSGRSTTGKTTAAYLIASVAGSPDIQRNGLLRSWNTTANALIKTLDDNYGYPIVFDEFGLFRDPNIEQMVYAIATGRERDRMNSGSTLQPSKGYRTTIVSTGEKNITEQCPNLTGIDMRVIELCGLTYTKSAKSADYIKHICMNNYGHAIGVFADYFGKIPPKDIARDFKLFRQEWIDAIPEGNSYSDRLSNKYATLLLTASYANQALGFNLNVDAIKELLIDIEATNSSIRIRDTTEEAYEKLCDFVNGNRHRFIRGRRTVYPSDIAGRIIVIKDAKYRHAIAFDKSKFKDIISSLELGDLKILLKSFRSKGVLICDKGRLETKRVIKPGEKSTWAYVIKMDLNFPSKETEEILSTDSDSQTSDPLSYLDNL